MDMLQKMMVRSGGSGAYGALAPQSRPPKKKLLGPSSVGEQVVTHFRIR